MKIGHRLRPQRDGYGMPKWDTLQRGAHLECSKKKLLARRPRPASCARSSIVSTSIDALRLNPAARGRTLCAGAAASVAPGVGLRARAVSHFHDLVAGSGVAGSGTASFSCRVSPRRAGGPRRDAAPDRDGSGQPPHPSHPRERSQSRRTRGGSVGRQRRRRARFRSFHSPSAIAAISDDRIVVYDEGQPLLVWSISAGGASRRSPATAGHGWQRRGSTVPLRIWKPSFVPAENALTSRSPRHHAVRRLDLKSKPSSRPSRQSPVPRPAALALLAGTVCLADRDGRIVRFGPREPARRRCWRPSGARAHSLHGGVGRSALCTHVVGEGRLPGRASPRGRERSPRGGFRRAKVVWTGGHDEYSRRIHH